MAMAVFRKWLFLCYDHKQILADYAAERITPEMAVGHSLQHIAQLYETQAATRTALTERVNTLQTEMDRLTAFMDKVLRAQKKRTENNATKAG